ncbi:MAG: M50 family metallopeptidase, partial [Planctomycetes bacterium]|nr:M50 family metallopeptidase [Planctomycetota bacterium]
MHGLLSDLAIPCVAQSSLLAIFDALWPYVLIFAGFSVVIFVHELGHFAAAKWSGVRVERFAIGFFTEIFGFTRGETRYSFNILPLGGYVKMLGQEDFEDKAGELRF